MDRQFHNEDFERLLRDNANQYRMYPSEKVWKGIDSALHSRRKWYGITTLSMLLITATIISLYVSNNNHEKEQIVNNTNLTTKENELSQKLNFLNKETTISKTEPENVRKNIAVAPAFIKTSPNDYHLNKIQPKAIPSASQEVNSKQVHLASELVTISENSKNNHYTLTPKTTLDIPEINKEENLAVEFKSGQEIQIPSVKIDDKINSTNQVYNEILAISSKDAAIQTTKKHAKLTAQFYLTPTFSYRTLTENKRSYLNGSFGYIQVDVNNLVKHKPAIGFEFGLEGRYKLFNGVSLKTGLQFNINRYDIKAYSYSTEIATVAVNGRYRTDSLSSLSNFRNFNGYNPKWIENFYFQVAMPIGAEVILGKIRKINWGISATVQPTYVIGDRAYMISSDYKNYAKYPDLMRRWNFSSGFEAFVSYSTGKIKWQIGPHARYQHLSSFVSVYPVKENLFAVGFKVGASINKKK